MIETVKTCNMCNKEDRSSPYPYNYIISDGISCPRIQEGWQNISQIDLCPSCVKEKLIPFLQENGVKI